MLILKNELSYEYAVSVGLLLHPSMNGGFAVQREPATVCLCFDWDVSATGGGLHPSSPHLLHYLSALRSCDIVEMSLTKCE